MPTEVQQTAIRMLARREHSCFELKQKLLQKGYSLEAITENLQKLIDQDLVNDQRFMESYIRSRIARGYGPLKISNELKEKGIAKELIAQAMQEINLTQTVNIAAIRAKKFGAALPTNAADRAKQIRFLQYKGFSWDQIRSGFKGWEGSND